MDPDPGAQAVVAGVAVERTAGDATRSLPELIFDTVRAALADAGCGMADVDGVVLAASDLIDGRSLSSMVTAPAAGAYLRDEIRVNDDGLVALSLGAARIEAGEAERVLVAAWGRPSESEPEAAAARAYDPFTEQPCGVGDLAVSALRAVAYGHRYGQRLSVMAAAVPPRVAQARRNPRAAKAASREEAPPYPLAGGHLPRLADTVAAVVLQRGGAGPRITGVGHATESFHLGDRDLVGLPGVGRAVELAMAAAGCGADEIDLVELGGRTLVDEILGLEAIGTLPAGRGFTDVGAVPVNRSGGGAAGECAPATGLARFVEAVLQLQRRAGGVQIEGPCRRALVVCGSATAGQTQTAVVVEAS